MSKKPTDNDPFDGIDLSTLDGWIKKDSDEKNSLVGFQQLSEKKRK